jgi:hypothetical protein
MLLVRSVAHGRCESIAGYACGIVGSKENRDSRDVVYLFDATKQRVSDHRLCEIASNNPSIAGPLGLHFLQRNSVDGFFAATALRRAPA